MNAHLQARLEVPSDELGGGRPWDALDGHAERALRATPLLSPFTARLSELLLLLLQLQKKKNPPRPDLTGAIKAP